MYFIKFTNQKWADAVINGESIKIGSFKEYRKIEDLERRDKDEGGRRKKIDVSPNGLTINNLLKVLNPEDEGFDTFKKLKDWKIKFENPNGGLIITEPSFFNALIFCCSVIDNLEDVPILKKVFKTDSYYYIKNLRQFSEDVADVIRAKFIEMIENSEIIIQNPDFNPSLIEFRHHCQAVVYQDKKPIYIFQSDIETHDSREINFWDFLTKPKRFMEEKEFRFIWVFYYQNQPQSTPLDNLVISISPDSLSRDPVNITSY